VIAPTACLTDHRLLQEDRTLLVIRPTIPNQFVGLLVGHLVVRARYSLIFSNLWSFSLRHDRRTRGDWQEFRASAGAQPPLRPHDLGLCAAHPAQGIKIDLQIFRLRIVSGDGRRPLGSFSSSVPRREMPHESVGTAISATIISCSC